MYAVKLTITPFCEGVILGACVSRWWFQICFYFHPYLGKWSNLTIIFQRGWNHQVVFLSPRIWWFRHSASRTQNEVFFGGPSTTPGGWVLTRTFPSRKGDADAGRKPRTWSQIRTVVGKKWILFKSIRQTMFSEDQKEKSKKKTHLFHDCGSDYGSLISFLFVDLLYTGWNWGLRYFSVAPTLFSCLYIYQKKKFNIQQFYTWWGNPQATWM